MPSFNVLAPEVDINCFDKISKNKKTKQEKTGQKSKPVDKKKVEKKKVEQEILSKKKSLKKPDALQALAFGNETGTKKGSNKQKKIGKSNGAAQHSDDSDYEEWKKVDENLVEDINKKTLEEAILQSKLEYEKAESKSSKKKKETVPEPAPVKKDTKNKKKKPLTVSLDEFNSNISLKKKEKESSYVQNSQKKKSQKITENNINIFEDAKNATQATIRGEKNFEKYKKDMKKLQEEEERIKEIKDLYDNELEKKEFEIQALMFELEDLKQKNKDLNDVLQQAKMKSRVELNEELEKVTRARDEYAQEVTQLGIELEQERSKSSALSVELRKLQGRKKSEVN